MKRKMSEMGRKMSHRSCFHYYCCREKKSKQNEKNAWQQR